MSLIQYGSALRALVVTKGHPYERDAFGAMLESLPGIACTQVEQPAAQTFFAPETAAPWGATLLYDMPGIEFRPGGPVFHEPPPAYVEAFLALLEAGHGFVFLHHALAGWPTWPVYAEIVGARFLYAPGTLRGRALPDSGYRHGVKHRVSVATPGHPVVEGLDDGFEIEDELYLIDVSPDVTPLLRSSHRFVDEEFYSAALAVRGKMFSREGWSHPPGSDLVAWTHRYRNSPIVTITCGDGPSAYASEGLRGLLANALRWVAAEV